MKNTLILKLILFAFLSIVFITKSFTQDSQYTNKWDIRPSYSNYKSWSYFNEGNKWIHGETSGNYTINGRYQFSRYASLGVYTGVLRFKSGYNIREGNLITLGEPSVDKSFPVYGANFSFHILSLIIKKESLRFDVYATTKLGGIYYNTPGYYPVKGHKLEYGLGVGLAFYLSKHFGIFTEYGYTAFSDKKIRNFRYGLSVKF